MRAAPCVVFILQDEIGARPPYDVLVRTTNLTNLWWAADQADH